MVFCFPLRYTLARVIAMKNVVAVLSHLMMLIWWFVDLQNK